MTTHDIIIIGSGPAGMSAAITASRHGASVILIDEQQQAGGQIYRGLANADIEHAAKLGKDYTYGQSLLKQLTETDVRQVRNATVWSADKDGTVTFSQQGRAQQLNAKILIIATGALERACPIPGWTLPGVMTVGAAQILLKTSGIVANQAVLAGTGPLLYAVANQILTAGGSITAIVDTVSRADYRQAARHFPMTGIGTIATGIGYLRRIKQSGVPHYRSCSSLAISGNSKAEGISFHTHGRDVHLPAEHILLHQGVVPNVQLSRSLGLDHQWHKLQKCFHPGVDDWGTTSEPSVRIAGDCSGIGGALTAEQQGRIVALGALSALGNISERKRNQLAATSQHAIRRYNKLRRFLDTLYRPPNECTLPADNTIICRCEEVTAGEIRALAGIGCTGPNQTKAFCRSGMGPCQGRYCGNTVTEILAATQKLPHDEIGYYRIRSPIKPVTLQEIAGLSESPPR